MPYIKKEYRTDDCNKAIQQLQNILQAYTVDNRKGIANYIITRIIVGGMKPSTGWSYTSLSNAISVFEDAAQEMRRRLLNPYEDQCIQKNGDVEEYNE